MSQDEFDKEWDKVISLNLESPSLHEIKDFLIKNQINMKI